MPTPDETAIALLQEIREALQSYGDQHLAKQPPQPDKAQVNLRLVARINDVLIELAREPLLLTSEMEVSGSLTTSDSMHVASLVHLVKFVETFSTRDEEDYVALRMRLGDLRILADVDGGQPLKHT